MNQRRELVESAISKYRVSEDRDNPKHLLRFEGERRLADPMSSTEVHSHTQLKKSAAFASEERADWPAVAEMPKKEVTYLCLLCWRFCNNL